MRWARTRVLPEPAPATISSGAPTCVTAARCCGLSPSSSASGSRPTTEPPGRPMPSAGGSPPACAHVGTPRSSTSPVAVAGLSLGRGKSPKSVLIVSSSLRRAGDSTRADDYFVAPGARVVASAWDQTAVAPLCPIRTACTVVPVAASTAVPASTSATHLAGRGAVSLCSFRFHHSRTPETTNSTKIQGSRPSATAAPVRHVSGSGEWLT